MSRASLIAAVAILLTTIAACGSGMATRGDAGADTGGTARACGAADMFAPIRIRAELPAGTTAPTPSMPAPLIFDVRGMVTGTLRISEPCPQECAQVQGQPRPQCPTCTGGNMTSVRLDVNNGATTGEVWRIFISPQGQDALDEWERAGEAAWAKPISLRLAYRHGLQPHVAFGFAISDEDGLIMASDGGQFVQGLAAEDTPSLSVTTGAPICSEGDRCRTFRQVLFAGTTSAIVGVADGEITIGSRRYGVRNQGARTLEEACRGGDAEEASPWSIWVRP